MAGNRNRISTIPPSLLVVEGVVQLPWIVMASTTMMKVSIVALVTVISVATYDDQNNIQEFHSAYKRMLVDPDYHIQLERIHPYFLDDMERLLRDYPNFISFLSNLLYSYHSLLLLTLFL
ncbi:hypothetical protein DICVIV_13509 [Dictyocaulus viviparus]|uniref:Uncharacterized protein n=1 Tax=Dictyocaulus viviparus TaxID=29172 RepID=A0A0D8X7L8_DICVI|nr:hypothetical protein DICVIV_13509 [Dictyocaulus viviparus]